MKSNGNVWMTRISITIWGIFIVALPEIAYSWTPNPQKGWATFEQRKELQKPHVLKELVPRDASNGIVEPDSETSKRDWDHYAINGGDPHFLFTEEHYESRNRIDRETVIEILVPLVAPVVAFLSYDFVAHSFHAAIEFVANNNWRAVDGGAYQAMIITPTINGIVLPAIAVLFATLTAMTIRTLRDRQIDIRSCINAEAGELRAFEYIISAYPSGSELQAMTRQYVLQYTSRIIAESQPDYYHPLFGDNLPSTQHGMDSELNGVLGLLARTDILPTLVHDQSFQSVWRLRQSRQNRLTALQSTYPTLHYGILAILASGEMTGFLVECNQELLVFLNEVQLKILWSMLVGTFVSCFMVFYDLLNPFSGCYQVSAAVDQLHTIRIGLKAQSQLSLLDYDATIQKPLTVSNEKTETMRKPSSIGDKRTEDKVGTNGVAEKVNGSFAHKALTVEDNLSEKVNGSSPRKTFPVEDKIPAKVNGSSGPKPRLVIDEGPERANGSSTRTPDASFVRKPLLVEDKVYEAVNELLKDKNHTVEDKISE